MTIHFATHEYEKSHPEVYAFGRARAEARLRVETHMNRVHVTKFEIALLWAFLGRKCDYESEQAFRKGFYDRVLQPVPRPRTVSRGRRLPVWVN